MGERNWFIFRGWLQEPNPFKIKLKKNAQAFVQCKSGSLGKTVVLGTRKLFRLEFPPYQKLMTLTRTLMILWSVGNKKRSCVGLAMWLDAGNVASSSITHCVHPSSSKWRLLGRPGLSRITAYVLLTIQWNCTLLLLEKSAHVVFSEKRRGLCAATLSPVVEQLIYFHQQRPDVTEKRPLKVFHLPVHVDLHLHILK